MIADTIKQRMTAQEYAKRAPTNTPSELINGELFTIPSPYQSHQNILMALLLVIKAAVPTGTLRFAPLDVHFDAHNVVQPDLFWVSDENTRCSTDGKFWYGAPDLVVEVLSEGTAKRDKMDKFALYEQHGVREYWIVNAQEGVLEAWQNAGQAFAFWGVFDGRKAFTSPVLGKLIDLKAIFTAIE